MAKDTEYYLNIIKTGPQSEAECIANEFLLMDNIIKIFENENHTGQLETLTKEAQRAVEDVNFMNLLMEKYFFVS